MAVMVVGAGFAAGAQAAAITVNTTTDESGTAGMCSLRDAISAANSDSAVAGCTAGSGTDTINLIPGTYTLVAGPLVVASAMSLAGAGQATTTIDGGGTTQIMVIDAQGPPSPVGISGVTFTGGQAPAGGDGSAGGDGGAIANDTGILTISNSTFTDNHAGAGGSGSTGVSYGGDGGDGGRGGAIFSLAPLALIGDTLESNSAGSGGPGGFAGDFGAANVFGGAGGAGGSGGAVFSTAQVTLTNDTLGAPLAGNTAGVGGDGGPALGGVLFFGGAGADGGSGGAVESTTDIGVAGSTASDNVAGSGGGGGNGLPAGPAGSGGSGGALQAGGTMTVSDSTFTSDSGGAAILFSGSTATLTNDTVAGNAGTGVEQTSGSVTLTGTLLASNAGGNCGGTIVDGNNNLSFPATDESCPRLFGSGDPMLAAALTDNGGATQTLALGAGSAAIDQIAPGGTCPATDQRGVPRPQGAACDIGAYEFTAPVITIAAPTSGASYQQNATVAAAFTCTEDSHASLIASCTGTVASGTAISTASPSTESFTVSATDKTGHTSTKSVNYSVTAPIPPPPVLPGLSGLGQTHRRWSEHKQHGRHAPPVSTTFRYVLSLATTVNGAITRKTAGRSVHGRCVTVTRRNRTSKKHCTLTLSAGRLTASGHVGKNTLNFNGQLGQHKLQPGSYRITFVATDQAGHKTKPRSLWFTIVR